MTWPPSRGPRSAYYAIRGPDIALLLRRLGSPGLAACGTQPARTAARLHARLRERPEMMKRMCDCGCDHAITDYDAGQTPIIIQKGDMLLEVRVLPGATGERPNVRPVCARAAVHEGVMLFPAPSPSWTRRPKGAPCAGGPGRPRCGRGTPGRPASSNPPSWRSMARAVSLGASATATVTADGHHGGNGNGNGNGTRQGSGHPSAEGLASQLSLPAP